MLDYLICAVIAGLSAIFSLIFIKDKYVKIIIAAVGAAFSIICTLTAIVVNETAKDRFNKCIELKNNFEMNYDSEDIINHYEAHNTYFQYKFLYEQIANSVEEDGVFSIYYWMDFNEIKLEVNK